MTAKRDPTQSVIRVGKGGRGFAVNTFHDGLPLQALITAAHCLPRIPPAHPARYSEEMTFKKLLGPLGTKPTVWTECLFADVMADLAILREPTHPDLYEQCNAYASMMDEVPPLKIADAPQKGEKVQVLSLDGKWEIRTRAGGPGVSIPLAASAYPVECRSMLIWKAWWR
jgi:hypothetical protein